MLAPKWVTRSTSHVSVKILPGNTLAQNETIRRNVKETCVSTSKVRYLELNAANIKLEV